MSSCSHLLALEPPKGVTSCKIEKGPGHLLSRQREGEEEMPRPLLKDTLRLPEPLRPPHVRPGGTLPRTAHLRCHKRAWL